MFPKVSYPQKAHTDCVLEGRTFATLFETDPSFLVFSGATSFGERDGAMRSQFPALP